MPVVASSTTVARFDLRGFGCGRGSETYSCSSVLLDLSGLLGAGCTSSVVVEALRFGGIFAGLAVEDGLDQPTSADRWALARREVSHCVTARLYHWGACPSPCVWLVRDHLYTPACLP